MLSAGRTCLAGAFAALRWDHLLYTGNSEIGAADGALASHTRSADCTGIISARHFQRQQDMLNEARICGARIVQLDRDGSADAVERRMPLCLVIDPDPALRIMREEIFGPYGQAKHRKIEHMFALRRLQLHIGRWLRPGSTAK
jgi:acyl-CoA reductase-like NAD-dependent aldehyde dehydrogenase